MLPPPLDATRLARLEAYAAALGQAELPALRDLRLALGLDVVPELCEVDEGALGNALGPAGDLVVLRG